MKLGVWMLMAAAVILTAEPTTGQDVQLARIVRDIESYIFGRQGLGERGEQVAAQEEDPEQEATEVEAEQEQEQEAEMENEAEQEEAEAQEQETEGEGTAPLTLNDLVQRLEFEMFLQSIPKFIPVMGREMQAQRIARDVVNLVFGRKGDEREHQGGKRGTNGGQGDTLGIDVAEKQEEGTLEEAETLGTEGPELQGTTERPLNVEESHKLETIVNGTVGKDEAHTPETEGEQMPDTQKTQTEGMEDIRANKTEETETSLQTSSAPLTLEELKQRMKFEMFRQKVPKTTGQFERMCEDLLVWVENGYLYKWLVDHSRPNGRNEEDSQFLSVLVGKQLGQALGTQDAQFPTMHSERRYWQALLRTCATHHRNVLSLEAEQDTERTQR